jgi:ubiquinone biosynthesis protein Coq4
MRNNNKYYWVKLVNDVWIIAKWNEQHHMWHLINGMWIRDSELLEVNENELLPPQ